MAVSKSWDPLKGVEIGLFEGVLGGTDIRQV